MHSMCSNFQTNATGIVLVLDFCTVEGIYSTLKVCVLNCNFCAFKRLPTISVLEVYV